MSANKLVPANRLGFQLAEVAEIAGVGLEAVHDAISAKELIPRYADKECIVRRDDLIAWLDVAKSSDEADKDELIQELQRRVNDLEHQLLSQDPFLPGNVYKKHAECFRSPTPTPKQEKHLYFMRCEGYIKIGVSADPQRRLTQIRGGSALMPIGMDYRKAELIHVIQEAGSQEYPTHWRFTHLRHTGEWFIETPELTEYIESLSEAAA